MWLSHLLRMQIGRKLSAAYGHFVAARVGGESEFVCKWKNHVMAARMAGIRRFTLPIAVQARCMCG